MLRLRKRITNETISTDNGKKAKSEVSDLCKDVKTDIGAKTPKSSKTKTCKSSYKTKKSKSSLGSDEESRGTSAKSKKHLVKKRSCATDLKQSKVDVKCDITEHSDSKNLHRNSNHSGTSTKISGNSVKVEVNHKPSTSGTNKRKQHIAESSSSESEWEEVKDEEANLDDYHPEIPKEGVEITIDCPDLRIRERKKKKFDEKEWIRLHINRVRKNHQLAIHKTHLLCLLAHGLYVNKILNCDTIKALALSFIPDDMFLLTAGKKVDKIDVDGIERIVNWFRGAFTFESEKYVFLNLFSSLVKSFHSTNATSTSDYNLMFIVFARILGFKVRFCVSLYPVTYKATNLLKKPNDTKLSDKSTEVVKTENAETESKANKKSKKVKAKKEQKISKTVNVKQTSKDKESKSSFQDEIISRPRRSTEKSYKVSSGEDSDVDNNSDKDFEVKDESSDDDFKKTPKMKRKSTSETTNKPPNRKILSSDSEPPSPQQSTSKPESILCWTEIFSKPDKQWICVECANNIINKPYDIEALAPKPVTYILAYDNESHAKDVTRRYCSEYMTDTVKLRTDPDWWEETLDPFLPPNSVQNKAEEKKLEEMLVNKPLPTSIQGFKNHPLYALKRHLLKFEAIYPPDAPSIGFVRGQPVYARDCVHQLHSRETWLKEARVVRIGEQPYKIVKARPKWDRIAGVLRTDLPLEIFGFWQTEPYEPPVAVGGKVPRNEYGNVELFKACMLPRGTVHLQLPGLNRIAKKLGIDCSPAVVGFDGHKGSVHAVFDGFIVCEEFKDTLLAAWDEEQENARKREEEKREKRIYGNWKKLIRGLLIRERIKLKYDTQ